MPFEGLNPVYLEYNINTIAGAYTYIYIYNIHMYRYIHFFRSFRFLWQGEDLPSEHGDLLSFNEAS